jgi:beta-galactosidase
VDRIRLSRRACTVLLGAQLLFGIIDLAGFKKDRYWMYQSRWRPDLPVAHILPHWTWPDRVGEVTPVHVFSEADKAELFLNGDSQGRRFRGDLEYRFRWDNITYEPGELEVVTYRGGQEWARDMVRTTGEAVSLNASADRPTMLIFHSLPSELLISVVISYLWPTTCSPSQFRDRERSLQPTIETRPTLRHFPSSQRKAFNGLALAIVRTRVGESEKSPIRVLIEADGLKAAEVLLNGAKCTESGVVARYSTCSHVFTQGSAILETPSVSTKSANI